jgi:hypothetical protein
MKEEVSVFGWRCPPLGYEFRVIGFASRFANLICSLQLLNAKRKYKNITLCRDYSGGEKASSVYLKTRLDKCDVILNLKPP